MKKSILSLGLLISMLCLPTAIFTGGEIEYVKKNAHKKGFNKWLGKYKRNPKLLPKIIETIWEVAKEYEKEIGSEMGLLSRDGLYLGVDHKAVENIINKKIKEPGLLKFAVRMLFGGFDTGYGFTINTKHGLLDIVIKWEYDDPSRIGLNKNRATNMLLYFLPCYLEKAKKAGTNLYLVLNDPDINKFPRALLFHPAYKEGGGLPLTSLSLQFSGIKGLRKPLLRLPLKYLRVPKKLTKESGEIIEELKKKGVTVY